jgi:hypothetical protein
MRVRSIDPKAPGLILPPMGCKPIYGRLACFSVFSEIVGF